MSWEPGNYVVGTRCGNVSCHGSETLSCIYVYTRLYGVLYWQNKLNTVVKHGPSKAISCDCKIITMALLCLNATDYR